MRRELKGITAKRIIWKKDGAKMIRIPANRSGLGTKKVNAVYDDFGDLVTPKGEVVVGATDAFFMDAYRWPLVNLSSSLSLRGINQILSFLTQAIIIHIFMIVGVDQSSGV